MNERIPNIVIRDAKAIYKNFSGKETEFNPAGRRNFNVVLDEEIAQKLLDDGWNVKARASKDDPNDILYTLPVEVRFDNIPPNVFMISGGIKTRLTERNVGELDYAVIDKLDLTISPSRWSSHGRSGIKAYLKTMYATVEEDELAKEYADIPYSGEPFDGEADEEALPF